MGYDKFVFFITKNLSVKSFDEVFPKENIEGSIISKYIYYDINFIIYKCINKIENDINNLLKFFYSIENNDKLLKYFKNNYLSKYINLNFLDKENRISIFKERINKVINKIIYFEILNYILFSLYSIHKPFFIKNIYIFFDGIPNYSKILEQRKRRLHNYLNSKNRKKYYNEYFKDNISHTVYDKELDIKYNYFNYIKNTYSINKNFGPQSEFLNNLAVFLKSKLNIGNKIKVHINDSTNLGEADYKILKHIEDNNINGDICIHSCDTDFLYFIILYQLKNENKYINLNLIKYSNDCYQFFNGKNLIQLFLNKYKISNNIIDSNINLNFLFDTLFFIQMFGNDIIPDSYEITSDINLSIYFKCHYKLYKNENFIININNDKTINFNNLLTFFKELNKYNLFTNNLLCKYFKIPKRIIDIVCFNLNYNINDFITKILIPYYRYSANKNKEYIDSDDIRFKYIENEYKESNHPFNNLNLSKDDLLYLKENIENIIDFLNKKDHGLIRLTTNSEICNNPYDSLYNYIVIKSINDTNNKLNSFLNFNNIENAYNEYLNTLKDINVKNYFDIIENQTKILFYDFNYYKPCNKIYYKYTIAPSISSIINFIENNNYYSLEKIKFNNIYFNETSHHLFITPYLFDNLNFINDKNKYILNIMNIMNKYIKNIFSIEQINLRNINPDIYLNNINQLIKLFKNNNIIMLYDNKYILN